MKIICEWHDGERPQFNVSVATSEGKQPFITVKGCRLASGGSGPFVSWPATKNQTSGKYWQHVWASEPFAAAVLAEAQASQPKAKTEPNRFAAVQARKLDDDIPF
jgi:hypothetical protein